MTDTDTDTDTDRDDAPPPTTTDTQRADGDDWTDRLDLALVWPALLVASTMLPWITVRGFINTQFTGMDADAGPILLVLGAVCMVTWVVGYRERLAWALSGLGALATTISAYLHFRQTIAEYHDGVAGELVGELVTFQIGIGLYAAALAALAIIFVAVTHSPHTTDSNTNSEDSTNAE